MTRKRFAPPMKPRRWSGWIHVTDAPESGEDYLTEDELKDMVLASMTEAGTSIQIGSFSLDAEEKGGE